MKINTANTISSMIWFSVKSPLLITANQLVREKNSLCSPWFIITLGTRQKLTPGRLFLALEQPRMRQKEGIACYCMTVFTPPRWRRLIFSDVISGDECSLISKCRWYPFFPREYSKLLIFEYYISDILVSDWPNADQCISTCANRSTMKLKRIGHRPHKLLNYRLKDVSILGCLFKQWYSTLPIERGETV